MALFIEGKIVRQVLVIIVRSIIEQGGDMNSYFFNHVNIHNSFLQWGSTLFAHSSPRANEKRLKEVHTLLFIQSRSRKRGGALKPGPGQLVLAIPDSSLSSLRRSVQEAH